MRDKKKHVIPWDTRDKFIPLRPYITHHDHEVVEFFFIVPWTGGKKNSMEFQGTYGFDSSHCALQSRNRCEKEGRKNGERFYARQRKNTRSIKTKFSCDVSFFFFLLIGDKKFKDCRLKRTGA